MSALYTSESKALSILELLVHTPKEIIPPRYKLLTLEIPPDQSRKIPTVKSLPKGWRKTPPIPELKKIGVKVLRNYSAGNKDICCP
jgi:hypothetical protein